MIHVGTMKSSNSLSGLHTLMCTVLAHSSIITISYKLSHELSVPSLSSEAKLKYCLSLCRFLWGLAVYHRQNYIQVHTKQLSTLYTAMHYKCIIQEYRKVAVIRRRHFNLRSYACKHNKITQHRPSHDGKEWTIWMLQGFGKVRQLFLQQETRCSLRKLAADHGAATVDGHSVRGVNDSSTTDNVHEKGLHTTQRWCYLTLCTAVLKVLQWVRM